MLRCDTAKKLRHSQSKGSRTSKMEQSRSRVIDRRCARCSRVQDGARPCRSASCTSTAASVFTTVSLSVEHGGAERRGFCRTHLHPPRAAPSCCGSAAARCSACGDAPSQRFYSPQTAKSPITRSQSPSAASGKPLSVRYRSTKREPPSPAPVATGHTCGGRKEHENCMREGRRQFAGTHSARAKQSLTRARAAQITRRAPLSGNVPRRARARRASPRHRQHALRGIDRRGLPETPPPRPRQRQRTPQAPRRPQLLAQAVELAQRGHRRRALKGAQSQPRPSWKKVPGEPSPLASLTTPVHSPSQWP
jgi:hypothetical protein